MENTYTYAFSWVDKRTGVDIPNDSKLTITSDSSCKVFLWPWGREAKMQLIHDIGPEDNLIIKAPQGVYDLIIVDCHNDTNVILENKITFPKGCFEYHANLKRIKE